MNSYIVGQVVRVYTVFSNGQTPTQQSVTFGDGEAIKGITGAISDPATVTLQVRANNAAEALHSYPGGDGVVVKDHTGAYYADITVNSPGEWSYRWEGTGTSAGLSDGAFSVIQGSF